jgi:hypothetical protein
MGISQTVEVYGIRETLAEIRDVDKALFFAIRAYMKRTGDTLGNRVVHSAPLLAPTRGFRHTGRTAWKPGTFETLVSGRNAKRGATGATPLLTVRFNEVGINIADMAGAGGARTRRKVTQPYKWRGTTRKHTVTTQGDKMIAALGKTPSRYIWPEANGALPMIQQNVLYGVNEYMQQLNRNLEIIEAR